MPSAIAKRFTRTKLLVFAVRIIPIMPLGRADARKSGAAKAARTAPPFERAILDLCKFQLSSVGIWLWGQGTRIS
jgi:hypothetical protein